ncbi:MAG: hypothetical protein ACR2OB_08485 [Solirubrobacteraceae bacterium]
MNSQILPSPTSRAPSNPLTEDEATSIRDAVAEAVLGIPAGLRAALEDDPDAYLRLVYSTRTADDEADRLLRAAVHGARGAGHSWDTVGRLLGVSRQAAQQRFGTPPPATPQRHAAAVAGEPIRKKLSPLTAFDEMAVLEQEGRRGWHVVDYGTLYHLVEASPWQWQHRRVVWSVGERRRRLEDESWQLCGTHIFPWAYYKRRLDLPAEPDLPHT